jgi:hypothetical protein
MKGQVKNGAILTAVLLVTGTLGFAQANMSAPGAYGPGANTVNYGQAPARKQGMPGTVNYVEGQAALSGQSLGPGSAGFAVVEPNQAIDTQAGFVEVLLTPGAFLRVGHNSEVVVQSVGLANVQLQVVRGEAMIEATELVKGTLMQVNMSGSTTQITERGLYDFDANQQVVKVLDGKAKLNEASRVKTIGKDHEVLLSNANLKSRDFDKQVAEADPLYVWSKARSEVEAEANVHIANQVASYGGWYGPGWYWDPLWADYAFLPGAGFLYSPFGFGFFSPGYVWAAPVYGFYGHGFYGRGFYGRGGLVAGVHAGGFAGGAGFHAGGFGGFHGGGRR